MALSRPPSNIVKPSPGLLVVLVLAWTVFGGMAWAVMMHGGTPWDAPLLELLHRHATAGLDALAVFLSFIGNTWPMVGAGLVGLGLLVRQGQRGQAWVFGLSVGGSMLLTQLIKALVLRPRPALWLSISPEHTFSFPSGHAMDTAALATALVFLCGRSRWRNSVWLLAPLFSLAVGWARMYLGVHYPSDVLAGWSAAVGWVVLVQVISGSILAR